VKRDATVENFDALVAIEDWDFELAKAAQRYSPVVYFGLVLKESARE